MEPLKLNNHHRSPLWAPTRRRFGVAALACLATIGPLASATEPATLLPKRGAVVAKADESHAITPGEAGRRAVKRAGGGRVLDVRPAPGGYQVVIENKGDMRFYQVSDDGVATPQTTPRHDADAAEQALPDNDSPNPTPY